MQTVDDLLRRLLAGEFGPWAGQGFVPNGITILRPDTWQWETITIVPGSADLTESVLGDPVDASSLTPGPDVSGLEVPVGLSTPIAGGFGRPAPSAVSAQSYSNADFVRTELGEVRLTIGTSNGVSGPLSPIKMGRGLQQVDKDGVKWLPVVRMQNEKQQGGGGSW